MARQRHATERPEPGRAASLSVEAVPEVLQNLRAKTVGPTNAPGAHSGSGAGIKSLQEAVSAESRAKQGAQRIVSCCFPELGHERCA